jgi:hypothetical protein
MNISEAEKIKNPILAFIAGMIFSSGITWGAISIIHAEQFKIYESAKVEELKKSHDLEKKCLEQKNELQAKENELQAKENEVLSLRKKLEVASGKVTEHKTTRLRALIEQIDAEISWKKSTLRRSQSGPSAGADQLKSDAYLRTEKELDSLLSRRDQAQKQMIEVNAQ